MSAPVADRDGAVRALLGLPPRFPLQWSRDGGGGARGFGTIRIEVPIAEQAPLVFGLSEASAADEANEADEAEAALAVAGALHLSCADDSADPARAALRDRIAARFVAAVGAHPAALATLRGGADRFAVLQQHFAAGGADPWHSDEGEDRFRIGILRLGFRCNQDCPFCWQGRDWPDAPPGSRDRIDRLVARGVAQLSITGGEPTLYKELPDLVAHAASRGLTVGIQTNAIALANPKVLDRLVEAGLGEAFVSFHSADEATSDALTRAPGTWRRTVAGIEACLRAGVRVRLNCVVGTSNVAGLLAHARFARDRFVGLHGVSYSHPNRAFDAAAYASASVPLDEVAGPLVAAARLLLEAGLAVEVLGSCGVPPCVVQDVPELLGGASAEAFPELDRADRRYGPDCDSCALRPRCLGLRREYHELHGLRGLRPVPRP